MCGCRFRFHLLWADKMAAQEDFTRPLWGNPIDEDLDWMRDTQNYLLSLAVAGSSVAPGWITQVNTDLTGDPSQPDAVILTKGTRQIKVKTTWL